MFLPRMEVSAQQGVFEKSPSLLKTGGEINSSTLAGGSATAQTFKDWALTGPKYSKKDTVNNTGTDEIYQWLPDFARSVYTWAHVTSISGTNTSCTVKLYATGDSVYNANADWLLLQTYTVSSTGNPYVGNINAGINWPYTGFKWVFTGVGTHSSSWYVGMNVK